MFVTPKLVGKMATKVSCKVILIACTVLGIIFTILLLSQIMGTAPYGTGKSRNGQHLFVQSNSQSDLNVVPAGFEGEQSLLRKLDIQCQSKYGKPILGKDVVVVYNRVPKCGSRTMLELAAVMGRRNGYQRPTSIITSSNLNQYEIVRPKITSAEPPTFLEGHVYYMDTPNDRKYVFINFIRDPLDRMVSQYYFSRFGDDKFTDMQRLHQLTKPKFMNETFDDCVFRNRSACVGNLPITQQLRHFCGYHPRCRIPSRWAVEEAKRNMDKFLLVGVTEQYGETLRLLEHLLPDFFDGLVEEYKKPKKGNMTSLTKSRNKIPPSSIVVEMMKEKLKYEYEVYNHAVNKFNRLKHDVFY